ncbi:hypothetical protein BBJ28_00024238 [Nothophytophthora sp. Chile5]|nr:hypothetical protein BBJ28_00024238 [Nothophytophthora sp. Chile5]
MAQLELQLQLPDTDGDGAFEALATANHRWLSRYARLHPSFSVEPALLERNSLWMNAFFQKSRMTTSASSPQESKPIEVTPNSLPTRASSDGQPHRSLDPLFGSPPPSPDGSSPTKKPVIVSEKYSWNPECINSVSGFEWWWRSLPQNHSSLEPTQKLKMVTKAAVRLHAKGELQRAIDLYLLALSSETNGEVEFRLRVNLACAYESNQALPSSVGEFRRALELNSSDPYARYKLGRVLTSAGEFDEARRQFETILDTYPQAKDGLKHLEDALEQHRLDKEAERAATAAAKARRSPAKPRSPMNGAKANVLEPVPPSTPGLQSSAPHRKKTPPISPDHATPAIGPSENNEHSCVVTPSQQTQQTRPAATLTESHAAPLNLLDLLVARCQEVRIDMAKLLKKLDPHQRGLVHRESIVGLFRIIGGVELDGFSDEGTLTSLNITPDCWESKGSQVFLRYKGFLDAYTAKCRIGLARENPTLMGLIPDLPVLVGQEVAPVDVTTMLLWRVILTCFLCHTAYGWELARTTRKIQQVTVEHHHDTMKDLKESPEQSTSSPPKLAPTANASNDSFYRRAIEELSRQTYAVTARAAMAQLRRNAELQQVRTLANQFADMCQVPLYFLELHPARKASERDEMQDSADGTMAADKV